MFHYPLGMAAAPNQANFDFVASGTGQAVHGRGRVSFHDTRLEIRVISLACLSEDLRSDIWYSQADIESMRTEARTLCRFVRCNPTEAHPDDHVRGLELRISLERQCRKQLTVQGVVEAQKRCADPLFLASVAQRCSALPTKLALAQAQKDYCAVYRPSMSHIIQLPAMELNINMPPPQPFPLLQPQSQPEDNKQLCSILSRTQLKEKIQSQIHQESNWTTPSDPSALLFPEPLVDMDGNTTTLRPQAQQEVPPPRTQKEERMQPQIRQESYQIAATDPNAMLFPYPLMDQDEANKRVFDTIEDPDGRVVRRKLELEWFPVLEIQD